MAQSHVDWHQEKFLNAAAAAVNAGSEASADIVLRRALAKVPVKTGKLRDALDKRKSKYEGGGWLVGVFEDNPVSKWEDSIGARAVFVEYGHAGPGQGKGSEGSDGRRRKKAGNRVTEPQSFLVSSLHGSKSKILKEFKKALA